MFLRHISLACAVGLICTFSVVGNVAQAEDTEEQQVLVVFSVEDLPVWRVDDQGEAHFDASLLISYITSTVEPDCWKSGHASIGQSAKDKVLFVNATRDVIDKLEHFFARRRAFSEQDVVPRLKDNLETASASNQRVLLFTSDPSVQSTEDFFTVQIDEQGPAELTAVLRNFVVQHMTPAQSRQLGDWKITPTTSDGTTLAILRADGSIAVESDFGQFRADGALDAQALATFLEQHSEKLPDARSELQSALAQAAQDGKLVLVQMSGPRCGPCVRLSRFLASQQDLVAKDYVHVKLDNRMANAGQITTELVSGLDLVPWMAILSSKGDVLATSVGDGGNIGFPSNKSALSHFRTMLETTSRRLSGAEIETIVRAAEEW